MKTIVSLQDLVELDIRPEGLFAEYQERLAKDVRSLWRGELKDVPCPGCGAFSSDVAFERWSAAYRECTRCRSLFVSPRPDEAAIVAFYRQSSASTFWREQVWPATSLARIDKVVLPRVDWVLDGLAEYARDAVTGVDLSPYGGPFVDRLGAEREGRVLSVFPEAIEGTQPVDFATAFDVFDRAPDLPGLVDRLARVVRPGGLLFLTAPNADGFDLQVLWDRYPALTPPDKMNVLSIAGLQARLGSVDWELIEISTPGMFDVEQVRRVVDSAPDAAWPRFVRTLIARGPSAQADFQEYLQRHRLASFARVVARRR